ncbi:MAG: hypothetical protein H0X16_01450 [Chloroflexi bacterium]|nr:hypothetical protein [Chloroflexota bacterium]
MGSGTVLVIAPDERWLRVLEITLRLGGYTPATRRSISDALRLRTGDEPAEAIVLDLGTDSTTSDAERVRELLSGGQLRAVVILPERFEEQIDEFRAAGAEVLIRPYQPSALYAALERARAGASG